MQIYRGSTPSGFEFEIEAPALDNMEFVDALAELDEGNPLAISKVGRLLLGDSLKEKLYNKIRLEYGARIPVEAFSSEIVAILQAIGDSGKK